MEAAPRYLRFLRSLVVGTALATVSLTSACGDDTDCTGDSCDPAPDALADTTPETTVETTPETTPNIGPEVVVVDGPLPPPDLPKNLA